MTQHDEQEHGVDVPKYVTEISNDNVTFISFCNSHISILFLIKTEYLILQHKKDITGKSYYELEMILCTTTETNLN